MKRKRLLTAAGILFIVYIGHHVYSHFFTKGMLIGTYANKNYDYKAGGEAPHVPDTLQLFDNGQFVSPYWGEGTWESSYSISGTTIELTYNYAFGKAGYNTYITRLWYGNPKIIMFKDVEHYYEKIN